MFEIICQKVAVNGQFLPGKIEIFWVEKLKFFKNLHGKINFFNPDPLPPDFKPD